MQPVWDFLATHRYILWIALGMGVFGILQMTVFYRSTLRLALFYQKWVRRLINVFPEDKTTRFSKRMLRWYRKRYRSRWLWMMGVIQSVILIAAAIAGLRFLN